jgi:hypothetical protein
MNWNAIMWTREHREKVAYGRQQVQEADPS